MAWKSDGDDVRRIYNFSYDAANRLMQAAFIQQNPDDNLWNNSKINYTVSMGDGTNASSAYDANGNILKMTQYGWKPGGSASTPIDSLTYTYTASTNKLLNVIDTYSDSATRLGDFRYSGLYTTALGGTKTTAAADYTYDGNGNLKKDRNKNIGDGTNDGITYNYLNLPATITVRTTGGAVKGTIVYTYDAGGNKLKKVTTEGSKVTTTLYLGNFNYVNDTLQYVAHEEGRIRPKTLGNVTNGFAYDYFLKDHLGNVRMVLTDQKDTSTYIATMEAAYRSTENALFYNIPSSCYAKSLVSGYPTDGTTSPNDSIMRLNGNGQKTGASLLLKVMAGDKIDMSVKYFYKSQSGSYNTADPTTTLLSTLASGISGTSGGVKGSYADLNSPSGPLYNPLQSFLQSEPGNSGKPKAFLNILLLDEQLKLVPNSATNGATNSIPVSTADALQTLSSLAIAVPKNGYIFIWVSNETQGWDVFFDNLSVKHYKGPLTEENHYYPFGLIMAGISSKAAGGLENKKKYNDIELDEDLGVEEYEAEYRDLDPQTGKWWQIDPKIDNLEAWSPYALNYDNPALYNDPLGDSGIIGDLLDAVGDIFTSGGGIVMGILNSGSGGVVPTDPWGPAFTGVPYSSRQMSIHQTGVTIGQVASLILPFLNGGASTSNESPQLAPANGGKSVSLIETPTINTTPPQSNDRVKTKSSNQGSGTGRGKNNRKPDQNASGDHSVIDENGNTTYEQNPKNPTGFDEVKRTDVKGKAHRNKDGSLVPTPHVHRKGVKDVTPAEKGKDY